MKQAVSIQCPSAIAAAILATVLTAEGHACVWLVRDNAPTVLTIAPMVHVSAAIDTTSTALGLNRRAR